MSDKTKILEGLQVIVTDLAQQADGHELQARIFASQGFTKLADKYKDHASEERGYVTKFSRRTIRTKKMICTRLKGSFRSSK